MKKQLSILLTLIMLVCSSMTVLAEEEQTVPEENCGVNVQVVDDFEATVQEVDAEELVKSTCMSANTPEKEIHLEEGTKLEGSENANLTRSASGPPSPGPSPDSPCARSGTGSRGVSSPHARNT
ncbi:MAG: hypothetical protein HFH20_12165, partial [Ruminococcus sp.]|nr:hypothetical protein [Ruminococcus sp.]